MKELLNIFAAAILIVGGLYASISTLLRNSRLERERTIRARVDDCAKKWRKELGDIAKRIAIAEGDMSRASEVYDELKPAHIERVDAVLALHGLERINAYEQVSKKAALGVAPLTGSERRSQWIMIWSAVLGVVLLGVAALLPVC